MFIVGGITCPQALQTCCDTPPLFGKDIPVSSFLFILRDSDVGDGLDNRQIHLDSFSEWKVPSMREGPVYESWLVLWIKGIVVRCGVRRFPTVKCTDVRGWCWDGRWIRWFRWLGLYFLSCPSPVGFTTAIVARLLNGLGGRFRCSGPVGQKGAAVQMRRALLVYLSRHRDLRCLLRGRQLKKSLAPLLRESPLAPSNSKSSGSCFDVSLARSKVAPRRIHRSPLIPLRQWRPTWNFRLNYINLLLLKQLNGRSWNQKVIGFTGNDISLFIKRDLLWCSRVAAQRRWS